MEKYSLLTLSANEQQKIYIHIDFVKPGKSTYFIEHKKEVNRSRQS